MLACTAVSMAIQVTVVQGKLAQLAEELVTSSDIIAGGKADSLTRKEVFEHIRKRHE